MAVFWMVLRGGFVILVNHLRSWGEFAVSMDEPNFPPLCCLPVSLFVLEIDRDNNLLGGVSDSNGFAAPAPAPIKPGLDGLDAFSFQGFKKELDATGTSGGGGSTQSQSHPQTQQQSQTQQPVYNNVPLNQIPPKGELPCRCSFLLKYLVVQVSFVAFVTSGDKAPTQKQMRLFTKWWKTMVDNNK